MKIRKFKSILILVLLLTMLTNTLQLFPNQKINAAVGGYRLPIAVDDKATVTTTPTVSGHIDQIDFDIWKTGETSSANSGYVAAAKDGYVKYISDIGKSKCYLSGSTWYKFGTSTVCDWSEAGMVVIQHSTTEYSYYLHLENNSASSRITLNQFVNAGDIIGVEGNTGWTSGSEADDGVHLHFFVGDSMAGAAPWDNSPIQVDFTNGQDSISYSSMTASIYTRLADNLTECNPIQETDWHVTSDCQITQQYTVYNSVFVENGATLLIKNNGSLDIDFSYNKMLINSDSKVFIEPQGKLY